MKERNKKSKEGRVDRSKKKKREKKGKRVISCLDLLSAAGQTDKTRLTPPYLRVAARRGPGVTAAMVAAVGAPREVRAGQIAG